MFALQSKQAKQTFNFKTALIWHFTFGIKSLLILPTLKKPSIQYKTTEIVFFNGQLSRSEWVQNFTFFVYIVFSRKFGESQLISTLVQPVTFSIKVYWWLFTAFEQKHKKTLRWISSDISESIGILENRTQLVLNCSNILLLCSINLII